MAAQHTLWTSDTFTGPYPTTGDDAGLVARSAPIANNNTAYNACKAVLEYEGLTPDGAVVQVGFVLSAVIEEEIAGQWMPQAAQFDVVKGTDEAQKQIVDLSPRFNSNPGTPVKQVRGTKELTSTSHTEGVCGENIRVSVYLEVTDAAKPQLTELTLSGVLRQYNA